MSTKVLLEAPILTQSGYGEHARFVYRAIKDAGLDIYISPLNWGTTGWMSEASEEREKIDECVRKNVIYVQQCREANVNPDYDMQIFVGIANEFTKKAKYSVLVTAGIETDKVSPSWILKVHSEIDKVIVPSEHAKDGFVKTTHTFQDSGGNQVNLGCNKPVDVVPYPVKSFEDNQTIELDLEYEFNFLSVAMWGVRKNLYNMVKWFIEEFREEPVGLVIKTSQSRNSTPDRTMTRAMLEKMVSEMGDKKCKVYLLHGDLSDSELHALYNNEKIKSYLSATHGEGYGLPLFEAAYQGLPIVCTDWSGHLDFLNSPWKEKGSKKEKMKKLFAKVDYDLKNVPSEAVWQNIIIPESQWAYPKEKSFKEQMRKMYSQHGVYKKFAKVLKENTLKKYEYGKVLEMMKESLIPDFVKPDEEWAETLSSIEIL